MVGKGNQPQMVLCQISEILQFTDICHILSILFVNSHCPDQYYGHGYHTKLDT